MRRKSDRNRLEGGDGGGESSTSSSVIPAGESTTAGINIEMPPSSRTQTPLIQRGDMKHRADSCSLLNRKLSG